MDLKDMKKKYGAHRNSAKQRNIPFLFTFEEWCRVWIDSGHWEERGNKTQDQYVMARKGDTGPYSVDNVDIKTNRENCIEGNAGRTKTAEARAKMAAAKLGKPQMKRTPEWIAKISASNKGQKRSAECRANNAAAQRARYA